jgi:hypothetical protein
MPIAIQPSNTPVVSPNVAPTSFMPAPLSTATPIAAPVVIPSPVSTPTVTTTAPVRETTTAPTQLLVCNPPITMMKREEMILNILNDITPESVLLTMGTSQNTAFNWIINVDEAKLCPDNVNDIVQRYTMAVNYYSLGGNNWMTCNALISPNVRSCPNQERHLSKADVCDWYNITCSSNGNITGIALGTSSYML